MGTYQTSAHCVSFLISHRPAAMPGTFVRFDSQHSEAIQHLRKRSRKGRGLGRTAPSLTGSSNAEPCNLDPAIFYMALSAGTRFDPDQSRHPLSGLKNVGVLAARNAMRQPLRDSNNNHPTPYDQFLYLLAEMEAVMQRGTIRWDAESALSAQQRLDRMSDSFAESGPRAGSINIEAAPRMRERSCPAPAQYEDVCSLRLPATSMPAPFHARRSARRRTAASAKSIPVMLGIRIHRSSGGMLCGSSQRGEPQPMVSRTINTSATWRTTSWTELTDRSSKTIDSTLSARSSSNRSTQSPTASG